MKSLKSENKNWNVMVYMAADNSLSEECIFSLKEMQRVGTAEGVKVIAQFHSSAKDTLPSRYTIRKHDLATGQTGLISSPIGDKDGELKPSEKVPILPQPHQQSAKKKNAVDGKLSVRTLTKAELMSASNPDVLEAFLVSSIESNSAQGTGQLVILSGHGSGAVGPFLKSNNPAASLSISDLRAVFQKLPRKIDIVLMDSCLMSMAEVAHELSGFVDLVIGAEGFELSTGWPYHRILETLNEAVSTSDTSQNEASDNEADTVKLACSLVNKYVRYYSDYEVGGVSVDQAVCDLKQSPALVKAVKGLQEALTEALKQEAALKQETTLNAILLAHWYAQSYHAERYVDLWDFCAQLIRVGASEKIQEACRSVNDVIDGNSEKNIPKFVLSSCFNGAAFQHSHGVSIYLPWAADTQKIEKFEELVEYKKLKFSRQTGWGNFIEEYLKASRRDIRNEDLERHKGKTPLCFIPTDDTRVGVRFLEPGSKGGSDMAAKVKNPPVEFFRETW